MNELYEDLPSLAFPAFSREVFIEVNVKKGMTFASGLRSVLRQDPDVIMVGEIRDRETAVMAIQSALTGHMVYSTLHTNDAAGAVTRLLDLGIEPYLAASSLVGVLAQRLVRKICGKCRKEYTPEATEQRLLGLEPQADVVFYRGAGCERCQGTGYRGRSAVAEPLVIDEAVRSKVQTRANASEILAAGVAAGMRTMRED